MSFRPAWLGIRHDVGLSASGIGPGGKEGDNASSGVRFRSPGAAIMDGEASRSSGPLDLKMRQAEKHRRKQRASFGDSKCGDDDPEYARDGVSSG